MAKVKLVLTSEESNLMTAYGDAYNVKILESQPLSATEVVAIIKFRNPYDLFRVGVTVGSKKNQLTIPEKKTKKKNG